VQTQDILTAHRIWSETDRRIESLLAQVREGVAVDEASNFSRYLIFSGIFGLLLPYEQDVPLPIRSLELKRKCDTLAAACGEWYSLHERSLKPRDAYVSKSRLEAIEARLARIEDNLRLSDNKLSPSLTETTDAGMGHSVAALHVIQGGSL